MLLLIRKKRGLRELPGLRPCGITPRVQVPFAFTAPLGLDNPMARTHVRLLGPCFKTGQSCRRPTRHRDANRASVTLAIRVRSNTHRSQSTLPGAPAQVRNFTRGLYLAEMVRGVKRRRSAATNDADRDKVSLRIAYIRAAPTLA